MSTEDRANQESLGLLGGGNEGPLHMFTHPQEVIIHKEKPLKASCVV